MTKTTLTALGAALIALGQELLGSEPATPPAEETPATPATPTPSRRGRPPKETLATPPTEPEPKAEKPAEGMPESELRELIKLPVECGKGEKVKEIITKHGGTKIIDIPPAAHAAFARDMKVLNREVEAMLM